MKTMHVSGVLLGLVGLCLAAMANAATAEFSAPPSVTRVAGRAAVRFAMAGATDVEVAVIDQSGEVVRHLAGGALGLEQTPPAPLIRGLAQQIPWDGLDDDGRVVGPGPFWFRVRAGMGVKLDAVAGGDPYAFWTEFSGQGDHAQWRITGLDAKPDGSVYLFGNFTPYGLPTLRKYDARGDYQRTVFPPPAGMSADEVRGWGINERADGSWTLKPNYSWGSSQSEWTLMAGGHDGGGIWSGWLVPTPEPGQLCLFRPPASGNQRMLFGVDGSLKHFEPMPALGGEPLPKKGLIRSFFSALTPDGKSLLVSGMSTLQEGFWREGQIWKVDLATRSTSVFFALTDDERGHRAAVGHTDATPYSVFQGVAVDSVGHVFVCDRMNQRVIVIGPDGKAIRSLPVVNPDAVAVSPKSRALYVTTRFGAYSGNGRLKLIKFADWSRDEAPAIELTLREEIGKRQESSLLRVVEDKGEEFIWVAYTQLPVRIYQDAGSEFRLVKDFYQVGTQRALDLQHMTLDSKTGDIYIADSQSYLSRMRGWDEPRFEPCYADAKTPIRAGSIAIDAHSRYLYTKHHYNNPVLRWQLDGEYLTPAPVAGSQAVVPPVTCAWVFSGLWERGMAACPGGLATLGVVVDGRGARWDDYRGPLTYFPADSTKAPWTAVPFVGFGGKNPNSGGVAFDRQGNLYVGLYDGKPNDVPSGFASDKDYSQKIGRIYKFARTGSVTSGNLFPAAPVTPAKIYDIHYGPLVHYPRFTVDEFGRIYYPNGLLPRIGVVDNEGNQVLEFGTWGNRDSLAGLAGDLAPTNDIPLAWPNSVQADDQFIYVSDMLNARLLRLAKTFAAAGRVKLE